MKQLLLIGGVLLLIYQATKGSTSEPEPNEEFIPIPQKCSAICNYDWIIGSMFVSRFMEDKKKYVGFHFSNCSIADLGIRLGDRFRIVGDTSGRIFTVKQFGHDNGTNTDTLVVTDTVLTNNHGIPTSGRLGILC